MNNLFKNNLFKDLVGVWIWDEKRKKLEKIFPRPEPNLKEFYESLGFKEISPGIFGK